MSRQFLLQSNATGLHNGSGVVAGIWSTMCAAHFTARMICSNAQRVERDDAETKPVRVRLMHPVEFTRKFSLSTRCTHQKRLQLEGPVSCACVAQLVRLQSLPAGASGVHIPLRQIETLPAKRSHVPAAIPVDLVYFM